MDTWKCFVCRSLRGHPLIWLLCQNGHLGAVRELIAAGAKVETASNKGRTPLIGACENGHLEITRMLIYAGAAVDVPNDIKLTPIMAACQNGPLAVVHVLITAGANVAIACEKGKTPLGSSQCEGASGNYSIADSCRGKCQYCQ